MSKDTSPSRLRDGIPQRSIELIELLDQTVPKQTINHPVQLATDAGRYELAFEAGKRRLVDDLMHALNHPTGH